MAIESNVLDRKSEKIQAGETLPLHLRISAGDATPWPSMKVQVHALTDGGVVPIGKLQSDTGCYRIDGRRYRPDPLDALMLRTLLQHPRSGDAVFMIGARDFGPVLALLRQHSFETEYEENGRVADVEILSEAAEAILELCVPPGAGSGPRVLARTSYRNPETGESLGQPLLRGANYWAFNRHLSPPPGLPDDPALRKMFDCDPENWPEYIGDEALDLIFRAKNASRDFGVRIDKTLLSLGVAPQPLKQRVRVEQRENGDVVVIREIVAPDGKRISLPKNSPQKWVESNGQTYRIPEELNIEHFKESETVSGDEIPSFLLDQLPKLKADGAQIDEDIQSMAICDALKPCINVDLTPASNDSVQGQFFFEGIVPAKDGDLSAIKNEKKPEYVIEPVEILAAAARGQRYLRQGNAFFRVDREIVSKCRKTLEHVAGAQSAEFEARDQQIPELLEWAKNAAADVQTPWNIYVTEAVDGAHKIKDEPASMRFHLGVEEGKEGDTWFTLNAEFTLDGEGLDEDELRRLAAEGQKWVKKNNKWIKIDTKALEKFDKNVRVAGMHRMRGPNKKLYYRFKPAARDKVTDLFSVHGTLEHSEVYRTFIDQLRGFCRIQALPMPRTMTAKLRPYQQQGFEWLSFLAKYGLNGVLADDMGLGKTAQTITQITRMKEEFGECPSLIVTPTSLLDNWRNECAKFSPLLKVLIYRGSPERRDKLRQELGQYDVVLGTYATVRNDASLLRQVNWRYVILDEAHFIKNASAVTAKAVKTIPAQHRLALTGTPIQNRLTELWSLFDFLMPEFLGRQSNFRETYEEPIAMVQSGRAETKEEQETGEQAASHLRDRIFPFVLRRLKTDVAKDLPPKIESDIFCRLCPEQANLYKGFSDSAEAKNAVNELVQKGADGASTAILAALTSLRKICNHTDLMYLPKNEGRQRVTNPLPGFETRSGKIEALGELLEECREGGHRSLIFCQLTSMLDIIEHFLNMRGLKFLRIDGETPGSSRQGLVEKFNADPSIDTFLISTRAGGAGLNLTGADTVIFYDHDWNPANDQQAQDRAYRIGQTRTVNVYKLICKGTLEEKILKRQALKKALANSIVQHDLAGVKDLTRDELLSLFTLSE